MFGVFFLDIGSVGGGMGVKSGQTAALHVGTSSNAAAYTLGRKGNRERKEERPQRSDTSPYINQSFI